MVVQATDGDAGAATATPEDTRSWFKVTVNVSDVDEQGTITLRPRNPDEPDETNLQAATLLQPQVGVVINAADLTDGDGTAADDRDTFARTTATYQWYRTSSRLATGTAISDGTESRPTLPEHGTTRGDVDIGEYLRVVATYTDGLGSGKKATAVSLVPDDPTDRSTTQPPSFIDGATTQKRRARDQ